MHHLSDEVYLFGFPPFGIFFYKLSYTGFAIFGLVIRFSMCFPCPYLGRMGEMVGIYPNHTHQNFSVYNPFIHRDTVRSLLTG
jgi:hypothetical protein